MNTREAHELWGISQRQVARYCKERFVAGARQDKNGKWMIPDGSTRPLYFDSKKATEQAGRKALILQALSKEQTIPDERISSIPGRVDDLFAELTRQGVIQKAQNRDSNEDKYRTHILTAAGETILKQNTTFGKIASAISQLPPVQLHIHLPQVPN